MQELNWEKGIPDKEGMYFVAVELGPAAGVFDFAEWTDNTWCKNVHGEVVAFIDVGSLINQLSIKWPIADNLDYEIKKLSDEDEPWSEV